MTAIDAWAIKAPDGRIDVNTVSGQEVISKALAASGAVQTSKVMQFWKVLETEGYRCVRVRVEEIENPKYKKCNLADCEVADKTSTKCKKCMAAEHQQQEGVSEV